MQKRTNRILSVLLALVMVLSMLPAAVFAAGETDALAGWNISLGDNIGVKFHLNSEDYTVTTTVNGAAVTPAISGKVVTVNVAAAQMTDIIGLTVKNGEETVHTGEYSVREYADIILAGNYDAQVKEMVKQMLNYGAAAQTYFDYNTGKLANNGISVSAAAVPTEVPELTVTDNLDGINLYGMSLVFRNKIAVRFYFNVTGDIANYTFSQGTPVEKDGLYYVEVSGINPQDMATDITLNVNDGALSVTYSPLTYIIRQYNSATSSAALKALVQAMYSYHLEAKEYNSIIWAGTINAHASNGYNENALYFSMAANAAPNVNYRPTAESNIQLIRNGETYVVGHTLRDAITKASNDQYYFNFWVLDTYKPVVENDIIVIEGNFVNADSGIVMNISKSYILFHGDGTASFSTEMPALPTTIEGGVMMKVDGYGWTGGTGSLIFKMDNTAPNGGYKPTDASNIKLIRDGETYDVGHTGANVINKSNDTWYTVEFWTIVDYKPMLANDILVIEGSFYNAAEDVTMNITKTYVLLNEDGSASFSTEMPDLGTYVEAGMMSAHSTNGWASSADTAGNLQFAMADNDAATGYYRPTNASNVKLIRNGVTYDVGHNLRDTISKVSNEQYILEFWTIADHKPMVANDILIVEGEFCQESSNTTLNITKTYILLNADGTATFSAAEPVPVTEVDCGVMSEHADGNASEIYFTLAANSIPVDEELVYPYAGTVQLVNSSNTSNVNANIYKLADDQYYLELDGAELTDGCYLIVEGAFANADNGITMKITKTYVLAEGNSLVYSETEPAISTVIDAGLMVKLNGYGWNENNMYFQMAANDAPDSAGYKPLDASCIKVIRDGETVNDAMVGQDVIYKSNDSFYNVQFWTFVNTKPLKAGDIIVFEGDFYNPTNDTILRITKTYALLNADSTVSFSAEMPNLGTYVEGGLLIGNENGWTGDGIYFSMNKNAAPYNTDWSLRYKPASSEVIKLLRDGNITNIANKDAETLVKYSETNYAIATWMFGSYGLKAGDILIVEGDFLYAAENVTLNVQKTYILLNADGSVIVSATEPVPAIDGGMMKASSNNKWSSTDASTPGNMFFAMDANSAPTGYYRPASASNVKLIRNGTTYDVGHNLRDTIYKQDNGDYIFEFWTIADHKPMLAGDILIVEGDFCQASTDTTLNISKTYVLLNADGTATFSDTEPVPSIKGGMMQAYSENKWNSTSASAPGNLWFALADNNAPTGAYKPTATSNVKLIRDGVTYDVGHTGRDTINKINNGWYTLEFWTIADYKPMVAGDILIVEGDFYQASTDTTLNISKTYVLLNADGSASYSDTEPAQSAVIDAGLMIKLDGYGWTADNLYFKMAANDAPDNAGYQPTDASCIKVIRNGETVNDAMVGQNVINKANDGWYNVAFWTFVNTKPLQAGDILVFEGDFYNPASDTILRVTKTYITLNADGTASFADKYVNNEADTEFGKVVLPTSSKNLKIGVWNGSYHVFTNERLAELKAAGITKIMGIDPQWTGAEYGGITGMLDRAAAYGIDVIVDLRGWDGETVPEYVNHEALMGFVMYDEPSTSKFDELAELKAKFDAVMPDDVLFFVNLYGSSAASTALFGISAYGKTYETDYVQQFLDKLGVEVLSWDSYPLVEENGMRTGYFQNFEIMASKNVPMWFTMLSSGHNTTSTHYEIPTAEDLRWQMAVAMTYGVQNIDHYIYTSHEDDYSCMYDLDTGAVTDLYYDIKDVNNEYLAWDNIYMAYNWVGVAKHSGNSNDAMLTKLSKCINIADHGVSSVSASENLLIGVFENNGNKAYMVTNAGSTTNTTVGDGKAFTTNDTTVTLTLDAANYKCAAIIDNGEISYVAVNNNTVTFTVEAYEGVFVIPVLN